MDINKYEIDYNYDVYIVIVKYYNMETINKLLKLSIKYDDELKLFNYLLNNYVFSIYDLTTCLYICENKNIHNLIITLANTNIIEDIILEYPKIFYDRISYYKFHNIMDIILNIPELKNVDTKLLFTNLLSVRNMHDGVCEMLIKLLMHNLDYYANEYISNINFNTNFNIFLEKFYKKFDDNFYDMLFDYFPTILDNIDLIHKISDNKNFFKKLMFFVGRKPIKSACN